MKNTLFLAVAIAVFACSNTSIAQTASITAFDSDRVQTGGPNGSADLYASGNDDTFQSYGIVSFNFTVGDFGVASATDLDSSQLTLTFNDRGFSDGTSFDIFFTADDFDATYTGLAYDDSGANDPNGINAGEFTSLTSLGNYALGFDITDGSLGGNAFNYAVDFSAVEAELLAEINAGSDFSLIIAASNNADDVTFSGVGNTFDPGDPSLELTLAAVPEPSSLLALGLVGMGALARRRR